jgi:membrane-associated phospholipid phosphatase
MNQKISSTRVESPNPFSKEHFVIPALGFILALTVLLTDSNVTIFKALREALSPLGEPFWTGITLLGDALVGPLFLIPFLKNRPQLIWEGTLAALIATAFTHIIKPIAHVARPPAVLDLAVMGPRFLQGSFPSGHTTTAFTVLGLLVMVGVIRGFGPILLAFILAGLVGVSRIVAGVHWPADMLMGMAGGWLSAIFAIYLAQRWPRGGQGWPMRLQIALLVLIALFDLLSHDTGYASGMVLQRLVALLSLLWLAWDAIEAYYLKDSTA